MFNWLGNLFPYSDLHSLNLDWLLSKMKETAAQAAQAIADSAKALAQVIEAKTAAQNAQTAAQNAQTAANNAQTAANNAANSAENAVNVAQAAKSAAQTAQSTAENAQSAVQTAQSTAETAQSAAENAQSIAETANENVNTLKKRFPIKNADIADTTITAQKLANKTVTLEKLSVIQSYLYNDTTSNGSKFPRDGSATIDQITSGIYDTYVNRLSIKTDYLQVGMDIREENAGAPNTVFRCVSPIVKIINKAAGLSAIAPIIVINTDTNDIYNGFIKLYQEVDVDPQDLKIKCEVIFNAVPPFDNNVRFVITANPVSAKLFAHV